MPRRTHRLYAKLPRGHRERLLPLREVAARPLTTIGIGRAGISTSPAGYEISSPARITHKVLLTLGGEGFLSTEHGRVTLPAGTALSCAAGLAVRYGTARGRWTRIWLNLADTPHWGEVARAGVRRFETAMGRRLELAMEGMLEELGAAQPVLPEPRAGASYRSEREFVEAHVADRYGWAFPPAPTVGGRADPPGELYARLLRSHVHELLDVPDGLGSDRQGARLDRLWAKVRESLHQGWTTDSLASAMRVSVATLHRMTRERYARTPGAMLNQLRMEQAKRLLSMTDEPVKQIAARLGYGSPFAFSNAFKKQCGISPQHYRERLRG